MNVVEDEDLLKEAIKTAFERDITVYDALYIALARKLDSKLITYDEELLSRFKDRAVKAKEALTEIRQINTNTEKKAQFCLGSGLGGEEYIAKS